MKWPIFSLLEPDFVYKIKMACVYGTYYVTVFRKISKGSWIGNLNILCYWLVTHCMFSF